MFDYAGGRKFLAFLLLVAVGVGAETHTKNGLSINLVYLLLGLYGAFTASNVGITLGTRNLKPLNDGQPEPAPEADEDVASQPPEQFQAVDNQAVNTATVLDRHADTLARIEETVKHVHDSVNQVVASIAPQNQALQFLSQSEQRRQMREISG